MDKDRELAHYREMVAMYALQLDKAQDNYYEAVSILRSAEEMRASKS